MRLLKNAVFIFLFCIHIAIFCGRPPLKFKKKSSVRNGKLIKGRKQKALTNKVDVNSAGRIMPLMNKPISEKQENNILNSNFFEFNSDLLIAGADYLIVERNNLNNNEETKKTQSIFTLYIEGSPLSIDIFDSNSEKVTLDQLQDFIDKYIIDILLFYVIKAVLMQNDVLKKQDEKLLEAKGEINKKNSLLFIKMKQQLSESNFFNVITFLERNTSTYKAILLKAIMMIIYDKEKRTSISLFEKMKFIFSDFIGNNEIDRNIPQGTFKKQFQNKLKKISKDMENLYEQLLYVLAYYLKDNDNNFILNSFFDEETVSFALREMYLDKEQRKEKKNDMKEGEKLDQYYLLLFCNNYIEILKKILI